MAEYEYDILLKNDFNTNGHTQWYLFQLQNVRKGPKYKFNVINFYKRSSMYGSGLRPLLYSNKFAQEKNMGWHRTGSDISYSRNEYQYFKGGSKKIVRPYYTLSFILEFVHDDDTCYLAHCFPYTYTDLQRFLTKIESDPRIRTILRRKLLCRSLAGNRCDVLTITNPRHPPASPGATAGKKYVVISARVHPGETNASWMMKGCIEFLVGDTPEAESLRDTFVFKVVPMLNPDGVILGSYRTGLAGCDLNRRWKEPDRGLHPTIYYAKALMERMRGEREIAMFVDLHGHSAKSNVFMYGCDHNYWGDGPGHGDRPPPEPHRARLFPAKLGAECGSFSYTDCRFHIRRRKESSSRVVCWREFTDRSYTLEASFGGADADHAPAGRHFGIRDFERIGGDLCRAMARFFLRDAVEMSALHQSILTEVALIPLDEADSDEEEGDGEDRPPSSDDDSDDETVPSPTLPGPVKQPALRHRRAKPAGKGARPKLGGLRSAAAAAAAAAASAAMGKKAGFPKSPLSVASVRRDATPREEGAAAAGRRLQERRLSEVRRGAAGGDSACTCPSCLVYAEFIAAGPDLEQAHRPWTSSIDALGQPDRLTGLPGPAEPRLAGRGRDRIPDRAVDAGLELDPATPMFFGEKVRSCPACRTSYLGVLLKCFQAS